MRVEWGQEKEIKVCREREKVKRVRQDITVVVVVVVGSKHRELASLAISYRILVRSLTGEWRVG